MEAGMFLFYAFICNILFVVVQDLLIKVFGNQNIFPLSRNNCMNII
jgi:hypothetical protein